MEEKSSLLKRTKKIILAVILYLLISGFISIKLYFNPNFLGSLWAHLLVGTNISDIVKIFPESYMVDTDVILEKLAEKAGADSIVTDTGLAPQFEIDGERYNCKCFSTNYFRIYTLDKV